ncbi:MAG: Ig-like domain-containing protein [bacterium]
MSLLRRIGRVATLVGVTVAYSCGGDSTKPTATPAAAATLEISPSNPVVLSGSSLQMAVVLRDNTGTVLSGRTVVWSSSVPAVATIDAATGLARAIGAGSTDIVATSEGKSATSRMTVTVQTVASVVIDSLVSPLWVGRSAQLAVSVRDSSGAPITGRTVNWTSSATSVVTVSSTGLLTGIAPGTSTITASVDGVSGTRVVVAQAVPSALITLLPTQGSVARGADYALTPVLEDIDGNAVGGLTITYTTSDASVATVSASGVVHPVANGAVIITGTVDGQQQATSHLTVLDPRTVSGQVITADGGAPTNLVFAAQTGSGVLAQRFSTKVDATSGAFSLEMPAFPSSALPVEYLVDAPVGATRTYHPSYAKLAANLAPNTQRVLLIPHFVVPDSGTYAGHTYRVDLNDAFIPVCTTVSDANCQSYWPSYYLSGIKNWADAARPIPLAIDRTVGSVSANDSVAMWATIRAMEADLGRSLYKPAAFTGYTSPGYTTGMVLASQDASVAPFAGYTNWTWNGQGMITQAKTRLVSSQVFANTSTVTHELNHALGFHHTCRWSTVMGGYGCSQQLHLSSTDVAYYHLAELVRRKAAATNPTWSVVEALQGVRVVELGMPSSSAIPASLLPLRALIALPGSDGAP